jgi:acetyl-CoA carboxylase biotin carboxyl carrier protein
MAEDSPQHSDVAFIEALARLLQEHELSEIEVDRTFGPDDGLSVRVSRHPAGGMAVAAPAAYAAPAAVAPVAANPALPAATPVDPAQIEGAVTSPMVGTVYLQPEPGSPAFARVGDQVEEGQTLLIVEAMKTMNHIPAPRAGRVARILVDDGAPVEYGAPLMILE